MLETLADAIGTAEPDAEAVESAKPGTRRLDFDNPPFPRTGRTINFTNEELYDLIEFP